MHRFLPIAALLVCHESAHAWETDQLTQRAEPLQDVTPAADEVINDMLDEVAEVASRRLGPRASDARVHRVLARIVHRVTAANTKVPSRGAFRGLGYGRFAAWLETSDLDKRAFLDRHDVFGGIPFHRGPILSMLGTCSTFRIADTLIGSDKPDHFLDLGYRYFTRAGTDHPERAVTYGTRTENSFLGWLTSSTFSRADLAANFAGYRFYTSLLDPQDGLFRWTGDDVVRVRDFAWTDWVSPSWDEVIYPSVYRKGVARWLDDTLPTTTCDGWQAWGPEVLVQRAQVASAPMPWLGDRSREGGDPFELVARCGAP